MTTTDALRPSAAAASAAFSSSLASFSAGVERDAAEVTRLVDEGDAHSASLSSATKNGGAKAGTVDRGMMTEFHSQSGQLDRERMMMRRRRHHRDVATSFVEDRLLARVRDVEGALLAVTDEALGMTMTTTTTTKTGGGPSATTTHGDVDAFTTPLTGRTVDDDGGGGDPPMSLADLADLCRTLHLLNVGRLRRLEGRLVERYGYGGSGAFGPTAEDRASFVPDDDEGEEEEEEMLIDDYDDDGGDGGGGVGAYGALHRQHGGGQPPPHPGTTGEDRHHRPPPLALLPSERGMALGRVSEGSERSSSSSSAYSHAATPARSLTPRGGSSEYRGTPATPTLASLKLSGFTSSILLNGEDGSGDDDDDGIAMGGERRSVAPLPPTMEQMGSDDDVIPGSAGFGGRQPAEDGEYDVDDEELAEAAEEAATTTPGWRKTEAQEGGGGGGGGEEDRDRHRRDEDGEGWRSTSASQAPQRWKGTTASRSSSSSATMRRGSIRSPFEDLVRSPSPAVAAFGGVSPGVDGVGGEAPPPSLAGMTAAAVARPDMDDSPPPAPGDVHDDDEAASSSFRKEEERGVVPPAPQPAAAEEEEEDAGREEVVERAAQIAAPTTLVPSVAETHSEASDDESVAEAGVGTHDAAVGAAPSFDRAVSGVGGGRASSDAASARASRGAVGTDEDERVGLVSDDAVATAGRSLPAEVGEHSPSGSDGGDQWLGGSSREDEDEDGDSSMREEEGDDGGVNYDGVLDDDDDWRSGSGDVMDVESGKDEADAALSTSVYEGGTQVSTSLSPSSLRVRGAVPSQARPIATLHSGDQPIPLSPKTGIGDPSISKGNGVWVDEWRPLDSSASCGHDGHTSLSVSREEGVVDHCQARPDSEVDGSTVSSQSQRQQRRQPSSPVEALMNSNHDSTVIDSVNRDEEYSEHYDDDEEEWETEESIATTVVGNHVRVVASSAKKHIGSPSGPTMAASTTTMTPHRNMSITCGGGDANDTSALASPIIFAPHDVVASSPSPRASLAGAATNLSVLTGDTAGLRSGRSPLLSRTPLASAWIAKHMSGGSGGGVGGTDNRSLLVDDAVRRLEERRRSPERDYSAAETPVPSSEAPTVSSSVPESLAPPMKDAKEAVGRTAESTVNSSSIKDVGKDEYDSAPRVVKVQVSYEQVNSAVEVLNSRWHQKCKTGDASGVQKMHFTEEEAYEIVQEKFGERKCKCVLMSLCYWKRLIIEFTGGAGDSEPKRKLFVLYRPGES